MTSARLSHAMWHWLGSHRAPLSAVANILILTAAYVGAFLLRFDFAPPRYFQGLLLVTLPASVGIHYLSFLTFNITRGWWRYVGVGDFLSAVKAAGAGALAMSAWVLVLHRGANFPRSVILLNFILVVGLTIGVRLAVRLWRQVPHAHDPGDRKRLLIVGAGDTGEALLREIRQSPRLAYQVVAFVDDEPSKRGAYINGVPVADTSDAIPDVVRRLRIAEIVVATPSAAGNEMRRITARCRESGVPFRVMPATWEVLSGKAGLGAAREVDIHDLLRRPRVELDAVGIGRFLLGKRVLVTGAAGSIGAEICRQVLRFAPAQLVCLDHDENALFYLGRALEPVAGNHEVRYRLADITDEPRLDAIFRTFQPEVVFHAAAHKHVPMIEANAVEGMRNNVFGTQLVATLAGRHEAEAFVLISTDKAVNPSSLMGASKRIAELVVRTLPFTTRYTTVRFGNVLGSQGSVVPLLKEQIAQGGPVTITHPEMRRYFMTIPEAVELVIQAAAMGKKDEIFLLDMGEPVKIVDLATDLIQLSGLRPGIDIELRFTGIRPGEKLYEELYTDAEESDRTTHPKILAARHAHLDPARFSAQLAELAAAVAACDDAWVRRLVPQLVPEYRLRDPADNVIPISAARSL